MWLWRLSSPTLCCLQVEPRGSRWCSLQARGLESRACRFQSRSESLRAKVRGRSTSQLKQPGREPVQLSPACLLLWSPQWTGWWPPSLERATCFTHSTNSNANLFQTHLLRHIQKGCLSSWPSHAWSVRFTHKINHHKLP